jgi:hypothetical protein
MLYQVAAFMITALISLRLRDRNETEPVHGHRSRPFTCGDAPQA